MLVPGVETGNGLVKMMIYFMGACAAGVVIGGKVPVVITSRSDEAQARLASIAAAVVALDYIFLFFTKKSFLGNVPSSNFSISKTLKPFDN